MKAWDPWTVRAPAYPSTGQPAFDGDAKISWLLAQRLYEPPRAWWRRLRPCDTIFIAYVLFAAICLIGGLSAPRAYQPRCAAPVEHGFNGGAP